MICIRFFCAFLFIVLGVGNTVSAQGTKAVFFSEDSKPFSVYLNGKLMNEYPMNQVTANQLVLKDYQFKLIWKDITQQKVETIIKVKQGRENVFVIYEEKGEMKIDLYGKAKRGMYSPAESIAPAERNGYSGALGCPRALSNNQYQEKTAEFNNLDYPADRMSFVKRVLQEQCLTVAQLKGLLTKVDYESDRVELAKFGYSYVFDRDNYSSLSDLFEYPGAYDEIQKYIEAQLNN